MRRLTDSEFEFILDDLEKKGLTEMAVRLELADHIGCMIEQEDSDDLSFESAYSRVVGTISQTVFPDLQNQILLSMNLKFQAMKKSAFVLGIVSTIFIVTGSLFKGLHLPGASIMLLVGAVIVVLGFLPLFFYTSYRENEGKTGVVLPLGAFLAVAFLVSGALFKVMHWPYAHEVLIAGSIILLVGFLPAYLVSVFRKSKETRNWSAYLLLVVLSGAVIFMLSSARISRDIIEKYQGISAEARGTGEYFSHQSDSLVKVLDLKYPDGDTNLRVNQIRMKSQEIHLLVSDIKKRLLAVSNNESEENLKNADRDKPCYDVLQKKKVNIQLVQSVEDYRTYLMKITTSEQAKKLIAVHLSNNNRLENLPLIVVLAKLNELDRNLTLAEYEALAGLGKR